MQGHINLKLRWILQYYLSYRNPYIIDTTFRLLTNISVEWVCNKYGSGLVGCVLHRPTSLASIHIFTTKKDLKIEQ